MKILLKVVFLSTTLFSIVKYIYKVISLPDLAAARNITHNHKNLKSYFYTVFYTVYNPLKEECPISIWGPLNGLTQYRNLFASNPCRGSSELESGVGMVSWRDVAVFRSAASSQYLGWLGGAGLVRDWVRRRSLGNRGNVHVCPTAELSLVKGVESDRGAQKRYLRSGSIL